MSKKGNLRDLVHILGQALEHAYVNERLGQSPHRPTTTKAVEDGFNAYTDFCMQNNDFGSDIDTRRVK